MEDGDHWDGAMGKTETADMRVSDELCVDLCRSMAQDE